jgi:superfamily II DNA or RNA helicase
MLKIDIQRLYPNQQRALAAVNKFLRKKTVKFAGLVQMPTGTGKSGVIAMACTLFPKYHSVLVLTPSDVLCDQIKSNVRTSFWEDDLKIANPRPKEYVRFTPSSLKLLPMTTETVYISTIQSLQELHSEHRSNFNRLKELIDLVIFDEGHREPARKWAEAVRALQKRTIIFTATPYRNDLRLFNVDTEGKEDWYVYSYQDAVDQKLVRKVEFKGINTRQPPRAFAKELYDLYKREFADSRYGGRVIIRCDTSNQIRAIVHQLNSLERGCAVGIHSTFPPKAAFLRNSVPEFKKEKHEELFYAHEDMLIEGVDDPRFSILVNYCVYGNARQLIQQIGRIVRNSSHRKNAQNALVLGSRTELLERWWENYKQAELTDDWEYYLGQFRRRFDPEDTEFHKHVLLPRSVRVYELGSTGFMEDYFREITHEMDEGDDSIRMYQRHFIDERRGCLWAYEHTVSSHLLDDAYHPENKLGLTFIQGIGNYLFFFNSEGSTYEFMKDLTPVDPRTLQKLFAESSRFTQMSLRNFDVSRHAIRYRAARGYSLGDSLGSLMDHVHYCSGISAPTDTTRKRYVGFSRGSVVEGERARFEEYCLWIKDVAESLSSDAHSSKIFRRFAVAANPPADVKPSSILIDIDEFPEELFDSEQMQLAGSIADTIPELFYRIGDDSVFMLPVGKTRYRVTMQYLYKSRRFKLNVRKEDHNKHLVRVRDKFESLFTYMNRGQMFRLTFRDSTKVFAHGHYYELFRKIGGLRDPESFPLNGVFHTLECLDSVPAERGEKGSAIRSGTWQPDSVFGLIDSDRMFRELRNRCDVEADFDCLLCGDMQKEIFDFLAVSEDRKRVVAIHAKSEEAVLSASFFQTVVGQAIKSLDYLNPHSRLKPPNLNSYDGPWRSDGLEVSRRVRWTRKSASTIWENVQKILQDPDKSIEVWIVIGRGFSYENFKSEQRAENPVPELIQIIYLLQSAYDTVAQMNIRLRVMCAKSYRSPGQLAAAAD